MASEPASDRPSGRFLLRIPPGLHAALRGAAAAAGTSLNDYCTRKLAAPLGSLAGLAPAGKAVAAAGEVCGEALVGVVAFGSWARGEAATGSDVDLLIVVDESLPLRRDLYRAWDATPATWEGREVEPHFVHLPAPGARVTGLWGEAAIDGVVLFEHGMALSAWLAEVRREIAAGRVVRRTVHGQPYWTAA